MNTQSLPLSLLALAGLLLAACASSESPASKAAYFEEHVKPVFQANCLRCHQGKDAPARLDLRNGRSALTAVSPRTGRPFIIPGDPDCSLIIAAVSRRGTHPRLMPRLELSLTEDEIGELSEWIEDGACWPEDKRGDLHPVFNPENP
jgi:mono/diheme cytochrome c family protein